MRRRARQEPLLHLLSAMSVLREIKRRVAASKAAFITPCLPTLADKPPSGSRWLHEIKHDGYRLQARRDADGSMDSHGATRTGSTSPFQTATGKKQAAI